MKKKKFLLGILLIAICFTLAGCGGGTGEISTATLDNYKLEMETPKGWFADNENETLQKREYQVGFVKTEDDIGNWYSSLNNADVVLKEFSLLLKTKEDVIKHEKDMIEIDKEIGYTMITNGLENKKIGEYDVYYIIKDKDDDKYYWLEAYTFIDENKYININGRLEEEKYSAEDLEDFVFDIVKSFKVTK